MKEPDYPLEEVLKVKKRRVEEAEHQLKLSREALKKEEEKLEACKRERDSAKEHWSEKLQQMRDEFDQGTTTDKIEQMKRYLDLTKEALAEEQKKVDAQVPHVEAAEKKVEEAREILRQRRIDVDKLETHRTSWHKEMRQEMRRAEERMEEEIGSATFLSKRLQEQKEQEREER